MGGVLAREEDGVGWGAHIQPEGQYKYIRVVTSCFITLNYYSVLLIYSTTGVKAPVNPCTISPPYQRQRLTISQIRTLGVRFTFPSSLE